jgi:two-component system, OmpR family, sensor histidine kinase TctE
VLAHEWMLNELVRNLLHNAIKHTPPGGALEVAVERTPQGEALLKVSNQGVCIGPERKAQLFQPFASMSGQQSVGLGLSICHHIVEALGGRLDIGSRSGNSGVEVCVWLPIR